MSSSSSVQRLNQELADQINEDARSNPNSPYRGKFVGIANGQVVALTDDLDELVRELEKVEGDPEKTYCLEAGLDYDEVQHIWRVG
jgi:hypothetical protein